MSYAFTGASGTGKTTLAQAVAEVLDMPYHNASVTRLMRSVGFEPVAPCADLNARITAQEQLLDLFLAELRPLSRPFVTDRTPIDMAAYLLGEITMLNATPEQGARVCRYMAKCLKATRELFDAVLVLRPLPFYDATATRPPPNLAYQIQIQMLIEGALTQIAEQNSLAYAIVYTDDFERRLRSTCEFITLRIGFWEELRDEAGVH